MAKRRAIKGTGSVYHDAAGNRWVGAVTVRGKRHRVYARTRIDARDKLNNLIRGTGTASSTPSSDQTVAELLEVWMRRGLAGRSKPPAPSTLKRHRWAADMLAAQIGHLPADRVTVAEVEAGLDALHDSRELSRSSLVQVRSTLRQAFQFGQERGELTRNPAEKATLPPDAARTQHRQALTAAQARLLLAELETDRLGLMFALQLRVLLRPGEVAGLHWEDVDLDGGTLNVRRGVQLDERGRASVVDSLKTVTSRRTIALPADLIARCHRHRRAQATERLAASSWADDRLMFTSPTGHVLSPPNVRRHLTAICEQLEAERAATDPAGDPFPTVAPNELRHSGASLLLDDGVAIERVADLLGHTTTRMVDATYRHRLRPSVEAALDARWADAR